MELQLALPAYEMVLKAGHTFNLLDARGAISVTERAAYIGRIRTLSRAIAQSYYDSRERLGFPMLGATGDAGGRVNGAGVLLVELNTEELPPKALKSLSEAFAAGIAKGLYGPPLPFGRQRGHAVRRAAPARGAHHERAAPVCRQAVQAEADAACRRARRGANWTQAFLKKLESIGRGHMARVPVGTHEGADTLVVENDGKADAIFLNGVTAGQPLHVALQAALDETLAGLPIPKVMSYQLADGHTTVQFVRPAHRLVAMHGHEVVPVHALGLQAGTTTLGHRFM